jgi:hypothetical protein
MLSNCTSPVFLVNAFFDCFHKSSDGVISVLTSSEIDRDSLILNQREMEMLGCDSVKWYILDGDARRRGSAVQQPQIQFFRLLVGWLVGCSLPFASLRLRVVVTEDDRTRRSRC